LAAGPQILAGGSGGRVKAPGAELFLMDSRSSGGD
jgi:hypothetical protein